MFIKIKKINKIVLFTFRFELHKKIVTLNKK